MQLHTWFFGGVFCLVFFLSTNFLLFIYLFIYFYLFFKLFKMQQHTCDFFQSLLVSHSYKPHGSGLGTRGFFFFFLNTLVILIQDGNTTNFYSSISQYTTASGISQYTTACMNMY